MMEFTFLCKHETVQYEKVTHENSVCYTYTVVSFCMLCKTKALNKAKVMYVYEKINCIISFQYILLYILVMLISPIVYKRMQFVQSPASYPH